jgi:hypothetical protein
VSLGKKAKLNKKEIIKAYKFLLGSVKKEVYLKDLGIFRVLRD